MTKRITIKANTSPERRAWQDARNAQNRRQRAEEREVGFKPQRFYALLNQSCGGGRLTPTQHREHAAARCCSQADRTARRAQGPSLIPFKRRETMTMTIDNAAVLKDGTATIILARLEHELCPVCREEFRPAGFLTCGDHDCQDTHYANTRARQQAELARINRRGRR